MENAIYALVIIPPHSHNNSYEHSVHLYHVVHGFQQAEYFVTEGTSYFTSFRGNVKGRSHFPLLRFDGTITSEGTSLGK